MARPDPIAELRDLVTEEESRIVRLWSKRLRRDSHELELPGSDLREPLTEIIRELARLLNERGEDALRLWPEAVRMHGARRYEQHFDADDLIREFKNLHHVLLHIYGRRHGPIPPEVAQIVAELIGEATASVEASFARIMRTEEVRFRDAAVMESVLHHLDVGILVVEMDGTVSFVTPPVSRLIGVPIRLLAGARSNQVLGAVLTQIQARHPTGEPFRVSDMPFTIAVREHRPVSGVTMLIHRHNSEERVLELSATPLWEEGVDDGEMIGVIQTMVDRTENAQKNRELRHAYDEMRRLQARLLQRTRTQALGQLASGAAHALNNFLNVLRLRITLLRRDFKPDHLDALDRTVKNIGDLIARLQEFSVQRSEEELGDVPFEDVVREALQLARGEIETEGTNITISTAFHGEGHVRADRGFLRELMVNLMLTARDRLSDGGKIHIETGTEGEWLSVRIRDSGTPYDQEDLARLFDPLKSRWRPHRSLLLGVAQSQAQRWGGELEAHNLDAGAEFVLRLPKVSAVQPQVEPPRPETEFLRHAPKRFQQTRRVLVVDDEPDNARMMAEVLSEEGYQVQMAQTGGDALAIWDDAKFDAALLDVMMPDISGWELARNIRQKSPQALIAIVTGADVRGQNRQNLALVDAVFRKPIDVQALDDFLSQAEHPAEGTEPTEDGGEADGAAPESDHLGAR